MKKYWKEILVANKVKLLYPIVIAILFIPSVFIYYNESALIHAVWYLVISTVGLAISSFIRWLVVDRSGYIC